MKITKHHLDHFYTAMEFYERYGEFENIEVPWFVSQTADDATKPQNRRSFTTIMGNLVGSAEQSFIQMMIDGQLGKGRFQTLTPCFRDDFRGDLHLPTFMKLELIDTNPDTNVLEVVDFAKSCFENLGLKTDVKKKTNEYDLVIQSKKFGEIEVGSYGKRTFEGFTWVYGTGLAEPRFSRAVLLSLNKDS